MTLSTLPTESLIQICSSLRASSDLLNGALVSRALVEPARIELYRHVEVDDSRAAKLLRTLQDQPHLGSYVHHIAYDVGGALSSDTQADHSAADVFEQSRDLFACLPNVETVWYDTRSAPVLPYSFIVAALLRLDSVEKAALMGTPNSMPLDTFLPVLDKWATTLRSLEIDGLTIWMPTERRLAVPALPFLTELRLFSPRVHGINLLALCAASPLRLLLLDMEDDDDAREDGSDGSGPSDQDILAILDAHSDTLRDVTIRRGWLGREGGDHHLGVDVVQRCKRLERLELHGQISCAEMMRIGLTGVRQLDLQFCSTLAYTDVEQALKDDRWPSLVRLSCHHTGYEEDYELSTVESLIKLAKRKSIMIDAGACLGPFNAGDPPSPPALLDITITGMSDVQLATPVLSPLTPRSARWPPATPRATHWPLSPRTPRTPRSIAQSMEII